MVDAVERATCARSSEWMLQERRLESGKRSECRYQTAKTGAAAVNKRFIGGGDCDQTG
jgi:hypothetical protein